MSVQDLISDAQISISPDHIAVAVNGASAKVAIAELDALIRALEGVRYMVLGPRAAGQPQLAPAAAHAPAARALVASPPAAVVAAAPAPRPAAPAPAPAQEAPVKRGPGRPRKTEAAPAPAKAAATAAPAAPKASGKRKRRSRKRVGDALVSWMQGHPGWHSEDALLKVVIDNRMTDATPKRALKIALGKQRGDVFEGDNHGNWKLIEDKNAGPPPTEGKKRGRKTGAAPAAVAPEGRGGNRQRRVRVKGSKSEAKADADAEGSPGADHDEDGPTAANEDGTGETGRTILVKRGQKRKDAVVTPEEREARQAKTEALEKRSRRPGASRWGNATEAEVERAKKNLLGIGRLPGTGSDN